MKRLASVLALALLAAPALAADPPKDFFFQKNDRIVFLGDSITEQYQYSSYVELYLTTRFPAGNFTFLNAGIGGDTANGGATRFQAHVLAEKPTAVTINFGMNDAGYGAFNPQANKTYVERTRQMLEMAKAAGVRVALLSPNAVDPRVQERFKLYVETQKQFYAPLADPAAKHGAVFVDQYAITRAAQEKMTADDPKAEKAKPYYDGFHTSPPGGLLMAHAILTGLKAPALVSEVAVDAGSGQFTGKQCQVNDVAASADGVAFTRTDEALPLPVQTIWLPMLPYTNHLRDLNWYGLKVTGLKDGDYTVSIDGTAVGKFGAKELAAGVNLGNVTSGPVWEQANQVMQAITAKNQLVHQRFRGVVMFAIPDWLADVGTERKAAELKKRMEKIEAAQAKVDELAKPRPRKFEVRPAK